MKLLLKEKPQKDGVITEYKCGLVVHGGWQSRLNKHKEFRLSAIGEYIEKLESDQEARELNNSEDEYQRLFNYMSKNHGLTLLQSEMSEIFEICKPVRLFGLTEEELRKVKNKIEGSYQAVLDIQYKLNGEKADKNAKQLLTGSFVSLIEELSKDGEL